jgi:pimeloyl-ACP methyl ester carboxylesterase
MTRQSPDPFALPHLDDIAGRITLLARAITRPVENTLADADIYRGLPRSVLFPDPSGVPEVVVRRRWALPGVVSDDLVFASAHEVLEPRFRERYERQYAATHTVYARRIRPAGSRNRPRILYLHGYMQPETLIEELVYLSTLALYLGVEIVQLQPAHHGRRTTGEARLGGEFFWSADLVRSVEALRQTLLDARSLLAWMQQDDDRPVGVMGLSLGGALTSMLTCLEPRFAFSIPLIGHMDLEALIADAPVMAGTRRDLRRFGWTRRDFAAFAHDIAWQELHSVLPPERIRIFAASDDRFFDPVVVERMWRDWGEPPIYWYPCSHMGFLPYVPDVAGRVRSFLASL